MLLIAKCNYEELPIELPDKAVADFLRSVYTRSRTGQRPTVKTCYTYMRRQFKSDEFERWASHFKGYYVSIIVSDVDKTYVHLRKCPYNRKSHA